MNIKPRTFMIASLAVVLTAMSTSTWAQAVREVPDREKLRRQAERQRPQGREMAKVAKIGQPAPNFKLKDSSGKTHSLKDYKGKLVVLQWINPISCPVCKRVNSTGVTSNMLKTIKGIDRDFVHLTIDSTSGQEMAKSTAFLTKYDIKSPALDDTAGKVGRLYGAKTTPHMYVIDKKGILRYAGAIDDDEHARKGADATNYVVNAIQQIAAGETVTPDKTKAYGCSVKYARGGDSRRGRGGERTTGRRRVGLAQMIGRLDTNGDGNLDAKELESVPEGRLQGFLDRIDTNKNGIIEKEEIEAADKRRRSGEGRERGGRRGGRGGDGGADGGKGGDGG